MSGFYPILPGSSVISFVFISGHCDLSNGVARETRSVHSLLGDGVAVIVFCTFVLLIIKSSELRQDLGHANETQPLSTLRAFSFPLSFFPVSGGFSFLSILLIYMDFFWHMQRWAIIRKRRGNLNVGSNSTGSQLSEARRAAHHAMSLALDMPVKNIAAARTGNPFSILFYF